MNEKQMLKIDKLMLKNSIRLSIGGFIFDGGDLLEIPELLLEILDEFKQEINKITHQPIK